MTQNNGNVIPSLLEQATTPSFFKEGRSGSRGNNSRFLAFGKMVESGDSHRVAEDEIEPRLKKIDRIRTSVEEGSYQVDAIRLAEKLISKLLG